MTNIYESLRAAAAQNAQLLKTISETEYSSAAYQQNKNYILTLKKQIAEQEKKLTQISLITEKEYGDHKRYRDSHMKRLAYRLGGKKEAFTEQATKEEKEWLDSVAMQLSAKNGLERLNLDLSEATKQSAGFRDIVQVLSRATLELDGPTPAIPAEDAKEREVLAAGQDFNMLQLMLSNENQARQLLGEADKFPQRAEYDVGEAKSHSTMDAWGVGGTWIQMAEQSELPRCQQHVPQTEMLISQAMRLQPAIQPIGDMQVAQMNYMSDILFDNIFSDLDMRDRIISSMAQIRQAHARLRQQIGLQDERIRSVMAELAQTKIKLGERREELQGIRREAFERLAEDPEYHFEPPAGPPPSYVGESV